MSLAGGARARCEFGRSHRAGGGVAVVVVGCSDLPPVPVLVRVDDCRREVIAQLHVVVPVQHPEPEEAPICQPRRRWRRAHGGGVGGRLCRGAACLPRVITPAVHGAEPVVAHLLDVEIGRLLPGLKYLLELVPLRRRRQL